MVRRSRRLLGAGLCVGALAAGLASVVSVHAQTNTCRNDPIITLSNGTQISIYEDINDSPADIISIAYELHVPRGLRATSISYTGPVSPTVQTVTVLADESPGTYDSYTVVNTKLSSIAVSGYLTGSDCGSITVSSHADGHSGQKLHGHVHLS